MKTFDQELQEKTADIELLLKRMMPKESSYQKTIFDAMEYSLMAGGKRLRPLLMQEIFLFLGGEDLRHVQPFMAAIEMIHTYSLIHDDLPALDNDDYRRGRLTSHKVFGEAMAILAGDALLNYAFETASKAFDSCNDLISCKRAAAAMKILSAKSGIFGMMGGQVVDVELTGQKIPEDVLRFIFELKTGALIEASMMIGAVLAGADDRQMSLAEKAAHDLGMAFQIRDDLLDIVGSEKELGKPVHSDEKNDKTTWVSVYGMDKALSDVESYTQSALDALAEIKGLEDLKEEFLYRLFLSLTTRNH